MQWTSACKTGSPYRDAISDTILMLQETQKLQLLYNKWWKERGVGVSCDADDAKGNANALGIENVGGKWLVRSSNVKKAKLSHHTIHTLSIQTYHVHVTV